MTLHPNALRVQEALVEAGSTAAVRELPESTHTSNEAAAALGVEVDQIAKTLVFLADGKPVLAVLRGSDRLDPRRLARHVGAARAEQADAETVQSATGFPVGGVSPLGLPPGLRVVIDRALEGYPVIWAAAGAPRAVFPTTFAELMRATSGETGDVRQR